MPLVPIDNTHITQSVISDAQYLRSVIQWAKQRYQSYNQNCTTAAMTAASISAGDQNYILAFIGDLNRLIQLSGGTVPSNADDMVYNITALLGMQ
jgi:hypothetical protein